MYHDKILLKDSQDKKQKLEKEILGLLQAFEDETRTEVYGIDMDHIRSNDNSKARVVDLRLKILL